MPVRVLWSLPQLEWGQRFAGFAIRDDMSPCAERRWPRTYVYLLLLAILFCFSVSQFILQLSIVILVYCDKLKAVQYQA